MFTYTCLRCGRKSYSAASPKYAKSECPYCGYTGFSVPVTEYRLPAPSAADRKARKAKKTFKTTLCVLVWTTAICGSIAWQAGRAERKAEDRAAAIAAQPITMATITTLSTYYDASKLTVPDEVDKPPLLGDFRVTVYTPYCDNEAWGYKTASGEDSEHLATCAVDPSVIKLGSVLYVGDLQVRAIDTGSAVKGNVVDIFFDGTPAEACEWLAGFGDVAPVWVCTEG
jgi:3D (Asp-Asp-Asp) domain-containing protein